MSLPRFTTISELRCDAGPSSALLAPSEAHHMQVRRIRRGEHIVLADSAGRCLEVAFDGLEDMTLSFDVLAVCDSPSTLPLTLYAGISRGERMELSIRMATEIGVRRIVPLTVARTIVRFADEGKARSKAQRWRSIAHAAAKQSGIERPPEIADPTDIDGILPEVAASDLFLVAWEECDEGDIAAAISKRAAELAESASQLDVGLLIGPEGGLCAEEVELLRNGGAKTVTLGRTILRCETACVVASSLALHAMGGLSR